MPGAGRGDGFEDLSVSDIYAAALRSFPDTTVFVFDHDLRYRVAEGIGFTRLGWSADEVIGRRPSEVIPDAALASEIETAMRRALDGETIHNLEQTGLRDPERLWDSTVSPLFGPARQVVGGLIVSRDVAPLRRSQDETNRWMEAAETERRLRERIEFLAGVQALLDRCPDRRSVMRAVAEAAVPRLGDWCSIHVFLGAHVGAPAVEVGHTDPELLEVARAALESAPYDPAAPGVARVIATGEPVLFEDIPSLPGGAQTVQTYSLRSSLVVPLMAADHAIGALTFSTTLANRALSDEDVTLAQALAGLVASTLENRRLAEVEREIASTLQRSLLPARLPEMTGADVAVGYWASGESTEVGGDFYDVFEVGPAMYALVVGDVCGSGPAAAAVTGGARHTIRCAVRHGDDHAGVLADLNRSLLDSWPETFCTVVLATVEVGSGAAKMTVVSGGHPLPIVVRADGDASKVGRHGLLIGAFDLPPPEPETIELGAGDTVVFYTDGAFDVPPPGALTETELVELVVDAARGAAGAGEVVEGIAARLDARVPWRDRPDDTAIVALRVLPAE